MAIASLSKLRDTRPTSDPARFERVLRELAEAGYSAQAMSAASGVPRSEVERVLAGE